MQEREIPPSSLSFFKNEYASISGASGRFSSKMARSVTLLLRGLLLPQFALQPVGWKKKRKMEIFFHRKILEEKKMKEKRHKMKEGTRRRPLPMDRADNESIRYDNRHNVLLILFNLSASSGGLPTFFASARYVKLVTQSNNRSPR